MRLLLDTNIIVDVISEREGYTESLQLLRYCEVKLAEGFISVISIMDAMYILRKYNTREVLREAMQTLIAILYTAIIQKSDITGAFAGGIDDYEDAVQANCAWRIGADYIVTRNLKDFAASAVPAISPREALELVQRHKSPQLFSK
jgi:predicted nucleic-acid-binding protein